MRDLDRVNDICRQLAELWRQYPDLRLGQLILNAIQDTVLYYVEDQQLIDKLKKHYENLRYYNG